MGKLRCGRALDLLCMFPGAAYYNCLCIRNTHHLSLSHHQELESAPLLKPPVMKLKDVIAPPPTLAFQLKPKMVVLRVSMHCNGCARKVEKHISKLEGVSSYQIDLETKMVVVTGDIVPLEVLESVSNMQSFGKNEACVIAFPLEGKLFVALFYFLVLETV